MPRRRLVALTLVSAPVVVVAAWILWPSDEPGSTSARAEPVAEAGEVVEGDTNGQGGEPTSSTAPSITLSDSQVELWQRVADCETGGDWAAHTGNGHYGGLQFTLTAWAEVGGLGRPDQAPAEEQMLRAQMLFEQQGWSPWPVCAAELASG